MCLTFQEWKGERTRWPLNVFCRRAAADKQHSKTIYQNACDDVVHTVFLIEIVRFRSNDVFCTSPSTEIWWRVGEVGEVKNFRRLIFYCYRCNNIISSPAEETRLVVRAPRAIAPQTRFRPLPANDNNTLPLPASPKVDHTGSPCFGRFITSTAVKTLGKLTFKFTIIYQSVCRCCRRGFNKRPSVGKLLPRANERSLRRTSFLLSTN